MRDRISLKRSWEGEPTWAAAGPDGARSPALIKGQVSPGSRAIVGGPASGGTCGGSPWERGAGLLWDRVWWLVGVGEGQAGRGEIGSPPPGLLSFGFVSCSTLTGNVPSLHLGSSLAQSDIINPPGRGVDGFPDGMQAEH